MMIDYPISLTLEECAAILGENGLLNMLSCEEGQETLLFDQPCFDSRKVLPGSLFYCKGAHFEPEYLRQALANGALAYVSEVEYSAEGLDFVPVLLVSDIRRAMACLNAYFYQGLGNRLFLTGITGTKGKSSVAYFLRAILDDWSASEQRPASAILSSIDNFDGTTLEESHMTTLENLDLYQHFSNAVKSGCSHLTMEVTSQALAYYRTLGLNFNIGCFMNFGLDHISSIEHASKEEYLKAKLRIFEQCDTAIVNLDTLESNRVLIAARMGSATQLVTFSSELGNEVNQNGSELDDEAGSTNNDMTTGISEQADFWASDIQNGADGLSFICHCPGFGAGLDSVDRFPVKLGLTGRFNVSNALAAIACATVAGAPLESIVKGLESARVPGRMELFKLPDQKIAIVDYAHNLMSFEALFESVKTDYPQSAITAVFGCPGYKAQDRRRDLAEVCARYNSNVILTEEDSGEEPTTAICAEIEQYYKLAGGNNSRFLEDRAEAIITAIDDAPVGAVILITGKGRETRQKRGRDYIPVKSDVQIVVEYIQKQQTSFDEPDELP
jgi:UDP-N-acetylmuramoyl-L-alanyl-D-glutamate--2,6-diaminopimelate ligase